MKYQLFLKKHLNRFTPLHCLFELTYRCNLSCVHCYIIKQKRRELDTQDTFNILDQLKDAGCLYLTFSGGELFLRKDWFAIAAYARTLNFALRLFTNGTAINKEIAHQVKALHPLCVEISLYGFKYTHTRITRVGGAFEKTIAAIKILAEQGVSVFVKAPLMRQNAGEIWRLRDFVKEELKVHWRGFGASSLLSPRDNGDRAPLRYRINSRQLKEYVKKEKSAAASLGKLRWQDRDKPHEPLCGAGFITCNVTPYGELNPCVQIRLENNNRLTERPFREIWHNHEVILKLRKLRLGDRTDCRLCRYRAWCFVCPGIALLERGLLTAKLPDACHQASVRAHVYGEICET